MDGHWTSNVKRRVRPCTRTHTHTHTHTSTCVLVHISLELSSSLKHTHTHNRRRRRNSCLECGMTHCHSPSPSHCSSRPSHIITTAWAVSKALAFAFHVRGATHILRLSRGRIRRWKLSVGVCVCVEGKGRKN